MAPRVARTAAGGRDLRPWKEERTRRDKREPPSPSGSPKIRSWPHGRSSRPCSSFSAVADILGWLAEGRTTGDIIADFRELTASDVRAALAFAADRERRTSVVATA